jgi:hypothetical protein
MQEPPRPSHTYAGRNQGELYEDVLKVVPSRIQPHLGVY